MTKPHAPSLRRLLNQLPRKHPVEAAWPELAREPKGGYIIFRNHTIRSTGTLHASASFACYPAERTAPCKKAGTA